MFQLYHDYIFGTLLVVLVIVGLLARTLQRDGAKAAETILTTILITLLGTGVGVFAALNLHHRSTEEQERQYLVSTLQDAWVTAYSEQFSTIKDYEALRDGGNGAAESLKRFRVHEYSADTVAAALKRVEDYPGLSKHVLYLVRSDVAMGWRQLAPPRPSASGSVSAAYAESYLFRHAQLLQYVTHTLAVAVLQTQGNISPREARVCQTQLESAKPTVVISEFLPYWDCRELYDKFLLPVFAKQRLGESFKSFFEHSKPPAGSVAGD